MWPHVNSFSSTRCSNSLKKFIWLVIRISFTFLCVVLLASVALIENSVTLRWAPPHHFPLAVGGRVYFRSSAVYVKEKGRDC